MSWVIQSSVCYFERFSNLDFFYKGVIYLFEKNTSRFSGKLPMLNVTFEKFTGYMLGFLGKMYVAKCLQTIFFKIITQCY